MLAVLLLLLVAGLWLASYRAPHSLRYTRACGEIQVLADRGIVQVDLVWGDTGDRGFEWDAHHRSASWGRTSLDTFRPRQGFGKIPGDLGFASWSYERHFGSIFSGLPGRVVFFPFSFVILFPAAALVVQLLSAALGKNSSRALSEDQDRLERRSAGVSFHPRAATS